MTSTKDDLSEREHRFAVAYVGEAHGNGTEAARVAGYKGSERTLATQASRLLGRDRVKQAIAELRAPREAAAYATREELCSILTRIVRREVTGQKVTPKGEVVEVPPSLTEVRKAGEVLARIQGWVIDPNAALPGGEGRTAVYVVAGGDVNIDLSKVAERLPGDVPTLLLPDNGRRPLDDAERVVLGGEAEPGSRVTGGGGSGGPDDE